MINDMSHKDLLKTRLNLKNTILLDNNEISFGLQPENGLLIEDFINNKSDNELLIIKDFLKFLTNVLNL